MSAKVDYSTHKMQKLTLASYINYYSNYMANISIWNPWRMFPRDMSEWPEDWGMTNFEDIEMDLYEKGDSFVAELKAPGFNKDNIDISIEPRKISISGKVQEITEEEKKTRKYYRKEMKSMSFTRTCDLPTQIVPEKAKAIFKNGVLSVTMPKSEEAKPKKVSVEVQE